MRLCPRTSVPNIYPLCSFSRTRTQITVLEPPICEFENIILSSVGGFRKADFERGVLIVSRCRVRTSRTRFTRLILPFSKFDNLFAPPSRQCVVPGRQTVTTTNLAMRGAGPEKINDTIFLFDGQIE